MKKILMLLMLLPAWSVMADNVTEKRARQCAAEFLFPASQSRAGNGAQLLDMVYSGSDSRKSRSVGSEPPFYVFNVRDGQGFVIIAGDDAVMPVLGYSMTNTFRGDSLPPNLEGWMDGYARQIDAVRMQGLKATPEVATAWQNVSLSRASGADGIYMETAEWNQDYPYNMQCPVVGKNWLGVKIRAVTGCVATAMAIVMRYHCWPASPTKEIPPYTTSNGVNVSQRVKTSYNWGNMPMSWMKFRSKSAKNQVSGLIADCGAAAQLEYGKEATSGYMHKARNAMVDYMNYSAESSYARRSSYTDEEWNNKLRTSLHNFGPVLYRGAKNDGTGGHMFVIDGYKDNKYHINWGWGNISNGYFALDAMKPTIVWIPQGEYSDGQAAILNLRPKSKEIVNPLKDISFSYDVMAKKVTFEGVQEKHQVKFTGPLGINLSHRIDRLKNRLTVDVKWLIKGEYKFSFTLDGQSKTLILKLQ